MGYPASMKHFKAKNSISPSQRAVSTALLAELVLIAGVILFVQSRYNPTRWQAPNSTTRGAASNSISSSAGTIDFRSLAPVTAKGD